MIKTTRIDTVFVLLIFCVFTASVLMVLMLGGSVYKNVTEMARDGYDERTCLAYVWTKVKNNDDSGNVYVGDFQGLSVLCLEENYDGAVYQTMIYLYDGWVRELYSEAGLEFYPEAGVAVIQADSMNLEQLDDGLIEIGVGSESLLLFPRADTGTPKGDNLDE